MRRALSLSVVWALSHAIIPNADAEPMTLDQVIALALEQAPTLAAARERIAVARGELGQARASPLHNPVLGADYADTLTFNDEVERSVAVGLSQELEIGGQRSRRTAFAELAAHNAAIQLGALERAYLADAIAAFSAVIHAQEKVELASEIVVLSEDLLGASSRRFAAGDIGEVEHNLIAIETTLARSALSTARAERGEALAELNRLIGLPPTTSIEAIGALPQTPNPADPLEQADPERRDLEAARIQVEMGGAEVALLESEVTPDLEISLGWEREWAAVGPDAFRGDPDLARALGGFSDTGDFVLLGLSIPIPMFNTNAGGIEAAVARQRELRLRAEALEDAIEAEIVAARVRLRSAAERLSLYVSVLPEIERNLGLLDLAFGSGYVGAAEVLTARDRFFRTRLDYLDARLDYARRRIELARALGLDPRAILSEEFLQ